MLFSDTVLAGSFGNKLQENRLMTVTADGINEYFRVYLDGWKSGGDQFWNEIRDKL